MPDCDEKFDDDRDDIRDIIETQEMKRKSYSGAEGFRYIEAQQNGCVSHLKRSHDSRN